MNKTVRVSQDLHEKIRLIANNNGVTISDYVDSLLRTGLSAEGVTDDSGRSLDSAPPGLHYLGQTSFMSGKMRVSDPCYDLDTWCAFDIDVEPGSAWNVYVERVDMADWGVRNGALFAIKPGAFDSIDDVPAIGNLSWEKVGHAGVDAGLCGFLNDTWRAYDHESQDAWVSLYTNHKNRVSPYGVFVSSGIGDGSYPTYVIRRDGQVLAVVIDFMEHALL